MALKPGSKLMNGFLIALSVVEEGKKGGERVRNGRGAEVVLKDLEHLRSLPEVLGDGVLKQVADRAILESRAKFALPELTGERVPSAGNQEGIIAGRGTSRGAEPVEDEVPRLEIILARLDWGKSKFVRGKRDRRHQNVVQRRFRPIGFITDRALGTPMTKRRRNGVDRQRQTSTSAAKWAGRQGRRTPPPYSHRQKNVQPNDPQSNPKKKPRMGGRRHDGMDERQNLPPRRGWESHNGSKEKPRCEKNLRRDRS